VRIPNSVDTPVLEQYLLRRGSICLAEPTAAIMKTKPTIANAILVIDRERQVRRFIAVDTIRASMRSISS
jgi:hypothetical protein